MAAKFDFGAFYLLSEGFIRGALRLRVRDELPYPWEDLANGRAVPTEAVAFSWDEGGEPRDLVGSSNMLDLISQRCVDLFLNQRLTGWTTYAVEVYGKDGERIEGLHGFAVLGRCGSVLWSKGQRIIVPAATPAGRATTGWRGLYFDADGWDGNDIFLPRNYGSVIVTERTRAAVEDAGLKNFHFTRLTEFERTWPADEADDKTLN